MIFFLFDLDFLLQYGFLVEVVNLHLGKRFGRWNVIINKDKRSYNFF